MRHGLMLVGYSYGAKTCIYPDARGRAERLEGAKPARREQGEVRVPSSTPSQSPWVRLYGQFDPVSHEWQDGVLAKKFRECAVDTSPDRKWVMFDGPVDAIWIENMNTVLDDNKNSV